MAEIKVHVEGGDAPLSFEVDGRVERVSVDGQGDFYPFHGAEERHFFVLPKPHAAVVAERGPSFSLDGGTLRAEFGFDVMAGAVAEWRRSVDEEVSRSVFSMFCGECSMEETTHPRNDDVWTSFRCSECGMETTISRSQLAFCPRCGRKVDWPVGEGDCV